VSSTDILIPVWSPRRLIRTLYRLSRCFCSSLRLFPTIVSYPELSQKLYNWSKSSSCISGLRSLGNTTVSDSLQIPKRGFCYVIAFDILDPEFPRAFPRPKAVLLSLQQKEKQHEKD
jgi:hypothetical protein